MKIGLPKNGGLFILKDRKYFYEPESGAVFTTSTYNDTECLIWFPAQDDGRTFNPDGGYDVAWDYITAFEEQELEKIWDKLNDDFPMAG